MSIRFPALLLALVSLPAAAGAGPLAPARASDLVHIRTFGTECDEFGGFRFDLRTHGDGTTELGYVLPRKRVLIVRSVRFDAVPGAGTGVSVQLRLGGNHIASAFGTGSTQAGLENGHFQGVFEFDPGLLVTDLSELCITTQNGGTPFATAVGFLAKDK